jgi:hypothetical protein
MVHYLNEVLLLLFVVYLGSAFGAGVYEAKIVIPQWTPVAEGGMHWDAEAARRTDPDHKFWAFLTTVPLSLLTLASLVAAWYSASPRRELWLGAAVVVLIERMATFAYFMPTMSKLQREAVRPSTVETTVSHWISLHHVRTGIYLAAWLTALQAWAFTK